MKRSLVGSFVASAMAISLGISSLPLAAQAQTASSGLTSTQISAITSLLQSFGADQTVIDNVDTALGATPTTGTSSAFCYDWTRNLGVGSSGADVIALTSALSFDSGSQSESYSVFTESTAVAVVEYQQAHNISPSGFVGPLTRAALNSEFSCTNPTPINPTQPQPTSSSITVTVPQSGNVLDDSNGKGNNFLGYIDWTSTGLGNNPVGINLLSSTGSQIKNIVASIPNTGTYTWAYDPTLPNGTYAVQVYVAGKGVAIGNSGYFQIVNSPAQPCPSGQAWDPGLNGCVGSITSTPTTPTTSVVGVNAVNHDGNNPTAPGLIWVYWESLGAGYTYTVSANPSYPGSVETGIAPSPLSSVNGINMGCWATCYNGGAPFPNNGPYTFTVTATGPNGQTVNIGTSNSEPVSNNGTYNPSQTCGSNCPQSYPGGTVTTPVPTITTQSFTVTMPSAGSILQIGQTYTIAWTGADIDNPTNLPETIYLAGGGLGSVATSPIVNVSVTAQSSYSWTVPSTLQPASNYEICMSAAVKGGSGGCSQPFSIVNAPATATVNSVTITSPTADPESGNALTAGTAYTFAASNNNSINNTPTNVVWTLSNTVTKANTGAAGEYVLTYNTPQIGPLGVTWSWAIPANWPTGSYTISASANGVPMTVVNNTLVITQASTNSTSQTNTTTTSTNSSSTSASGGVSAINHTQNAPTSQGLIYVSWPSQGSGYSYSVSASPSYTGSVETTTSTGVNMGCWASNPSVCYSGGGAFPSNGPYTFTVTATSPSGAVTTVGTSAPELVSGLTSTQTSSVLSALQALVGQFQTH